MNSKRKIIFAIIVIAIIGAFILNQNNFYRFFEASNPDVKNVKKAIVTKVIDGDTVIIEGGAHVRLLGIDADERGYPCYFAAKKRLEELVLNKEVYLEMDKDDKDQYGRYLRYLILDGENINLKLVQEGLAVARFYPGNTKYKKEIVNAEKYAIENKIGCKWNNTRMKK